MQSPYVQVHKGTIAQGTKPIVKPFFGQNPIRPEGNLGNGNARASKVQGPGARAG